MNKVGIEAVQVELETGMQLAKCVQCGCMASELDTLNQTLQNIPGIQTRELAKNVAVWKSQMKPTQYACLGCDYCYPATAHNAFSNTFPEVLLTSTFCEGTKILENDWPKVPGEYFVLDRTAPVAVVTLASINLAEELARLKPTGLSLVGKLETENIGVVKVIENVISNPAIQTIIIAGVDSKGHNSGSALLSLKQNGVDSNNRVIGSTAMNPILRNVSKTEIEAFRRQVKVVDMRGCEVPSEIITRISELSPQAPTLTLAAKVLANGKKSHRLIMQPRLDPIPSITKSKMAVSCSDSSCTCHSEAPSQPEILVAVDSKQPIPMDKAGYFVILPIVERGVINVEHYGNDNTLLHSIEGPDARSLYLAIVNKGWLTELSHAAYLGKELAKAELSLKLGFKYVQDGA